MAADGVGGGSRVATGGNVEKLSLRDWLSDQAVAARDSYRARSIAMGVCIYGTSGLCARSGGQRLGEVPEQTRAGWRRDIHS
jgi:hypothetical protein